MARPPHSSRSPERERYGRNDTPYKSLRYVSCILEDTGRRTIHVVRTPEGGLTNDPDAVLQAVLDSFQAQHEDALPELDLHTRSTIREHVPRVFNQEQRRAIEHDPFSIAELQRAVDRLKKGVVPRVEVYRPKRTNASPCPSNAAWQPACGTSSRAPRPSPLSGPTWSTPSTRRGTGRSRGTGCP